MSRRDNNSVMMRQSENVDAARCDWSLAWP